MTERCVHGAGHPMFKIYGDNVHKVKVAWLTTGNGVGFEIFEFIDPPVKSQEEVNKDW